MLHLRSFILHVGFGCCREAFWSVLYVYPIQFSLQITVIWEDIKSECVREIAPFFEQAKLPVLEALYSYGMSKHSNVHWPFQVWSSSYFRKLLKSCNTLYISPFVLVIHVNHICCTLVFLLSVSKLHGQIFQNINHLKEKNSKSISYSEGKTKW